MGDRSLSAADAQRGNMEAIIQGSDSSCMACGGKYIRVGGEFVIKEK